MRSPRRPVLAFTMASAAVLATIGSTVAVGPPVPTSLGVGLQLSAAAPLPGYGVAMSALMADGSHYDLVLETGLDGITRQVTDPVEASPAMGDVGMRAGGARIAGGPGACSDGGYNLLSFKWQAAWDWWFYARSTPGEIASRTKAEKQLRAAATSITRSRNDCGLADTVNARASYQGRTTARPNIRRDRPYCTRERDDRSVVGFGDLSPGVLGITCTAYVVLSGVDRAVESDVLLNKDDFQWRTSLAGCGFAAIVRSVATHEFGHVFGLDHVSERNHGQLTMSESIGACDDSAFTLGRGDVLGLRQRY